MIFATSSFYFLPFSFGSPIKRIEHRQQPMVRRKEKVAFLSITFFKSHLTVRRVDRVLQELQSKSKTETWPQNKRYLSQQIEFWNTREREIAVTEMYENKIFSFVLKLSFITFHSHSGLIHFHLCEENIISAAPDEWWRWVQTFHENTSSRSSETTNSDGSPM